MTIKNFWSIEPGELIFAEELFSKYPDKLNVYFPLKDTGVDLLAISKAKKNSITFQIKESRYYKNNTWHQETKKRIQRNRANVDFYIFIIYYPSTDSERGSHKFEKHYIIVPMKDLIKKIEHKSPDKNGKYSFYFHLEKNNTQVKEIREKKATLQNNKTAFDYSSYLNAWHLIDKKI